MHTAELFHVPNNFGVLSQIFMEVKRTMSQEPHPVGHMNMKIFFHILA